jgi:hypothetical protein
LRIADGSAETPALQVSYPLPDIAVQRTTYFQGRISRQTIEYKAHMAKLKKEIRELEAVLWKCKGLQTFRHMLRAEQVEHFINDEGHTEYRAMTVDNHQDLKDLLLVLLNAVKCKHFQIQQRSTRLFLSHAVRIMKPSGSNHTQIPL